MASQSPMETLHTTPATMQLPAPTVWPIVLAFGLTLIFAGLVTSISVSILGAVLALAGTVGWFRDILPHEAHETVPVSDKAEPIITTRPEVARVGWITHELNRSRLPLEIYPVSAGIKGGLAGSVVMAVRAMIYGMASEHGVWYPINLLAAGFFPARNTTGQIAVFHWDSFVIAVAVHLVTSLIVGLLYGAMLPVFPRRPILLGGLVAPLLWSASQHSWNRRSTAQPAHRLVLVCAFAGRIRHRCWHRGFQARARAHLATPAPCRSGWDGGARSHG